MVCENNLVRRIVGVKRADKRRMDEGKMEAGLKDTFKTKLPKSRLTRAVRVERLGNEKGATNADTQNVERKAGEEDCNCDGVAL